MSEIVKSYPPNLSVDKPLLTNFKHVPFYFSKPVRLFQTYDRSNLRPDLIAGLTVAVILLPQALAFALIAELPPQMGIYAAVVAAIIGGLWGSSNQVSTGPTNAISLLVLSALLAVATPGTVEFVIAAGLMAVMVGVFQLAMGLARLGVLVNFVSHSVIVGFTAGAGLLIAINQLRPLLGLEFTSHNLPETVRGTVFNLANSHWITAALGLGTMVLIVAIRKLNPKLPSALISMAVASILVFVFDLDQKGVAVIGELPQSLPPLADLPLLDLGFISRLSTGALAVGAIALVETTAISRSIASHTGQRLDSNQEFVGQGLANIGVGFLSGYPVAGSFSRSAVNFKAGARSPVSSIFAGMFVLVAMFTLAPLAAYLPRTALAGVLIITAYGMVDRVEIRRILRGTRGDALIMVATLLGTLLLHIEFAVLLGILLSFALYIMKTSVPRVFPVLPDETFNHFVPQQPDQASCPQLGIIKISGDLYFGAVSHVEEIIHQQLTDNPGQRFLLLRMQGVNQCDFSGVHMLEAVRQTCRERGGDLYFMKLQEPVYEFMKSTGFYDELGDDHFLTEDDAISNLFYRTLDPAICIYECPVRAFKECQNLPKRRMPVDISLQTESLTEIIADISPQELRQLLINGRTPPLVIDVREPREFAQGHVPQAQLIPLPKLVSNGFELPQDDREIILVCRTGRRSTRAAQFMRNQGYSNIRILHGGMLAWEAAGLIEALGQ
jgi:SulP family sulfate permease